MTMVAYYGKMKALWNELANYEQVLTYTFRGCKCNIRLKLEDRWEKEQVHQFLMGLDNMLYRIVWSSLHATKPLLSLNSLLNLIQEEKIENITRAKKEWGEIMGLVVQTSAEMKGWEDVKDKTMVCSNYNWVGHDASNCFQWIGYLN